MNTETAMNTETENTENVQEPSPEIIIIKKVTKPKQKKTKKPAPTPTPAPAAAAAAAPTEPKICIICCETIKKSISCIYCNYTCCQTCATTYLKSLHEAPKCMNCKKVWNNVFLKNTFSKTFVEKELKELKKDRLLERERGLIPATLQEVEQYKMEKEWSMKKKNFQIERDELTKTHYFLEYQREEATLFQRLEMSKRISILSIEIHHCDLMKNAIKRLAERNQEERNQTSQTSQRKQYLRGCPSENCKGFLSTTWNCGLCNVNVCRDCNEIISSSSSSSSSNEEEKKEEHTCKPENVETAKLILKDSKPCPTCSSLIFKIDGCNQMFCTQCHTAFDWRTLIIEQKNIHNPHYYEWLRNQGRQGQNHLRELNERNNCGENIFPGIAFVHDNLLKKMIKPVKRLVQIQNSQMNKLVEYIYVVHRNCLHLLNVVIPRYQYDNTLALNKEMRIKYILNEITEKHFKKYLCMNSDNVEKKNEIRLVLEMFVNVAGDIFKQLANNNLPAFVSVKELQPIIDQFETLRVYTVQSLKDISKNYNNCVIKMDIILEEDGFVFYWDKLENMTPAVSSEKEPPRTHTPIHILHQPPGNRQVYHQPTGNRRRQYTLGDT